MFFLGGNEYEMPRPDLSNALLSFYGTGAGDDKVEVFAVLVKVIGRCSSLLVAHDARQHVIDAGKLLVDKEYALSPGHHGHELGKLVLMENVGHKIISRCLKVCVYCEISLCRERNSRLP